jgi:hypothetical protein
MLGPFGTQTNIDTGLTGETEITQAGTDGTTVKEFTGLDGEIATSADGTIGIESVTLQEPNGETLDT